MRRIRKMTAKQKKLFLLTSMMSVFVMAVAVLFTGGKFSLKTPFARATNSGNYSVSFSRTICGGGDYNSNDFTKESQLSVSKATVYAHVVNSSVPTTSTDFARFKADSNAYIEFNIDSNVSFQEISGFSFVYNASYPNGDFDIYLSTDGSTYPASPNAQVRNAPSTVNLSGYNVKKIKLAGVEDKYAYFNTITINYACGEAAPKSLSSISVSGYTEEYDVGDTFEFDGTVTAHYSDSTSLDVTSSAVIDSSAVDLSSAGEYEIGVSYSDSFGSAETSYSITVSDGGGEVTSETYSNGSGTNVYWVTICSDNTGYYNYIYTAWQSDPVYYTIHFTWSLSGSTYTFTKNSQSGDSEYVGVAGRYRCLFGGSNTTNTGTMSGDDILITLRNSDGGNQASSLTFKKV